MGFGAFLIGIDTNGVFRVNFDARCVFWCINMHSSVESSEDSDVKSIFQTVVSRMACEAQSAPPRQTSHTYTFIVLQ